MRKILAIILAVAMLTAMLAVSVSAEQEVGGADGVTTFNPTKTGDNNINVKVTEITHKYAVDITFGLEDLTIGSIVWNVNTMKYDVTGSTLANKEQEITVSNRSDLPVYAYATVKDTDTANNKIAVTAANTETNKLTVDKATAGTGTANGTANEDVIKINITSDDWAASLGYYVEKMAATNTKTFKIATVTVTISKD